MKYEDIHWGERPSGKRSMKVASGSGANLGSIRAISYASRKGGSWSIYRHEVEAHDGRYPRLVGDGGMTVKIREPPKDLIALGRAIDLELSDDERIFLSGFFVVTDMKGDHVYLASDDEIPLQIEQIGMNVTERGIEN